MIYPSPHNRPLTARRWGLIAALAILSSALTIADGYAQQQLRLARSSVDVDWSVLDELDTTPLAPPRLAPLGPQRATTSRNAVAAPRPIAAAQPAQRPAARTASSAANTAPSFTPPPAPPSFGDTAPARTTSPATASATTLRPPPPPPQLTLAAPTPLASPAAPPSAIAPAPPLMPEPAQQAAAPPPPVVAPAPVAAPAPVVPPPSQVASLPAPTQPVEGNIGRIDFGANVAELPGNARDILDRAVAALKQDDNARLAIVAYASGGDEAGSQARRLSLSRALSVRSYLIDQGLRSTRMDVRALGNRTPDTPGSADRVDVVLVRR